MFKHRDNTAYAPFTTDPRGDGVGFGAAPEVAGRKRQRDIRGIAKFREVVYGEQGLPRLHAMIARNPTLMYPPAHTDAARARLQDRRRAEKEGEKDMGKEKEGESEKEREREKEVEEEERCANEAEQNYSIDAETDEQRATYHHRQLDALIGIYYEFNHMTFMKLPMSDTLQLLQRCGKEAVAHCMEFEMHLRMQRETRLRQLDEVAEEERRLAQRRLDAQEEALAREVRDAEEMQRNMEYDMNEKKSQGYENDESKDVSGTQQAIEVDADLTERFIDDAMAEINGGKSANSQ